MPVAVPGKQGDDFTASIELDDHFAKLLLDIEEKLPRLPRGSRVRARLWLEKLKEPTNNSVWKRNRNHYARLLLEQATVGELIQPFHGRPPEGPLQTLPIWITYRWVCQNHSPKRQRPQAESPTQQAQHRVQSSYDSGRSPSPQAIAGRPRSQREQAHVHFAQPPHDPRGNLRYPANSWPVSPDEAQGTQYAWPIPQSPTPAANHPQSNTRSESSTYNSQRATPEPNNRAENPSYSSDSRPENPSHSSRHESSTYDGQQYQHQNPASTVLTYNEPAAEKHTPYAPTNVAYGPTAADSFDNFAPHHTFQRRSASLDPELELITLRAELQMSQERAHALERQLRVVEERLTQQEFENRKLLEKYKKQQQQLKSQTKHAIANVINKFENFRSDLDYEVDSSDRQAETINDSWQEMELPGASEKRKELLKVLKKIQRQTESLAKRINHGPS